MVISMSNLSDLWLILSAFHDGHKAIMKDWWVCEYLEVLGSSSAAKQNGCNHHLHIFATRVDEKVIKLLSIVTKNLKHRISKMVNFEPSCH